MRNFDSLPEWEVLALAISLEEEDERVYADFAEGLRENFGASAAVFDGMRAEESGHRRRLIELYRLRFGEHIPLIRRQDVKGFVERRPTWLIRPLGLDVVRKQASTMEGRAGSSTKRPRLGRRLPARANCWMTWRRRSGPRGPGREAHRTQAFAGQETRGGRSQAPALRAADRATGAGGAHGRIGLHAGAGIRRGLRHAQQLGRFRGGLGGLGGRRHQHGVSPKLYPTTEA